MFSGGGGFCPSIKKGCPGIKKGCRWIRALNLNFTYNQIQFFPQLLDR